MDAAQPGCSKVVGSLRSKSAISEPAGLQEYPYSDLPQGTITDHHGPYDLIAQHWGSNILPTEPLFSKGGLTLTKAHIRKIS